MMHCSPKRRAYKSQKCAELDSIVVDGQRGVEISFFVDLAHFGFAVEAVLSSQGLVVDRFLGCVGLRCEGSWDEFGVKGDWRATAWFLILAPFETIALHVPHLADRELTDVIVVAKNMVVQHLIEHCCVLDLPEIATGFSKISWK